nr:uncharacterized protein LOC111426203 [Onthophagus taurus]
MGTKRFFASLLVCFFLGIHGKPSLSFNLPNFAALAGFGQTAREQRDSALKQYSGKRVTNDSLRMVYFYDQTVAVAELGPRKLLLNCELLEVYEPEEALMALGQLSKFSRPVAISFPEMMTLMSQCQQVDSFNSQDRVPSVAPPNMARGLLSNNPLTLLSGIIPGTKWCGTGDIAKDYHDLGAESKVDRCCRTHDLCPVKVRAYTKRYNLTNNSLYTKSHCKCDDELYKCLKRSDSPTAHIMGNVYFNLIQVPCLEESKDGPKRFRAARNNF